MKQLGGKMTSFVKTEIRRLATGDASAPTPREGDEARDRRDWEAAVAHYTRYLKHRPKDGGIIVQLGHALKESGQLYAAKAAYAQAAALLPNDADVHLQIGHLAKLMSDRPAMLAGYARAFDLEPTLGDTYGELMDNAPRTLQAWADSATPHRPSSPHDLRAPVEPRLRAESPSRYAVTDVTRAALDTKRVVRAARKAPFGKSLTSTERDYALSKFGVFNSTYSRATEVFTALAGLSGRRPDQSVDLPTVFGLGIVPASFLPDDLPPQPGLILQRYSDMQVAATERLKLRPELRGQVNGTELISILMPVYRGPAVYVERAILSVLMQTYKNIQLCIVDDCSQRADITALLSYYAAQDERISLAVHEVNKGIAAATNTALQLARGRYVGLLDHDDMVAGDAAERIAERLHKDPLIDWVYTDECKIDGDDIADELFAKPDWSPALLTSVMYTGHFSVYRKSLVEQVGGFRSEYDFSQDYDLALRIAERSPRVVHIAECLYGWRMIEGSAAQGGKPMARFSNLAALQDAADRRHLPGRAIGLRFSNRLRRDRPAAPPLVSLIIPSDNAFNITTTIASICLVTSYPTIQIIVVTNSSCADICRAETKSHPVDYVTYDRPYNFSDKCNQGAAAARGDYLVFFNDDVRAEDPEWLDVVMEALTMPGVGIVGPKLLYENASIQHGGMVSGVRNLVGTAFHTFPDLTPAHFGLAQTVREVSLICGACLAIKASAFRQVGGFDAANTPIAHSDVDLCFRVREAGLSCVYTPHTSLIHIGHLSISATKKNKKKTGFKDKADIFLLQRWGAYCSYDPYFPPAMRDTLYVDSPETYELHIAPRGTDQFSGRNILLVSHDLSGSGAPKVVFDMAEQLRGVGHYVLVVSPEDGPFRERLLRLGADVLIDALCLTENNQPFKNLAKNFDIVVANTIVSWPVINLLADETEVFWYVHETELVGHLKRLHPALGRDASHAKVWAGSKMAAAALQNIGIKSDVLEYGVAPSTIAAAEAKPDKVVVSVLATYEPRKGQDLALLAIQLLPKELRDTCEFRFAGRINDQLYYDSLLEMDVDAIIRHGGTLTLEAYAAMMASTDIVLCPSRDDTLPLVSLDALANGKILVCSKAVGTSAYIENGVSGYVCATSAPAELARSLTAAINSKANWPVMAVKGHDVFQKNFSIAKFRTGLFANLRLDSV